MKASTNFVSSERNDFLMQMRNNIIETRKRFKVIFKGNDLAYNAAIKAYLRGYYAALKNVKVNIGE